MYNVPPKFNQVCRLCLTYVSNDCDVQNLTIFNQNASASASSSSTSTSFAASPGDQSNKSKRSNEISIKHCADDNIDKKTDNSTTSSTIIKYNKNGADCISDKKKKQKENFNGEDKNDENITDIDDFDDDDSDLDITKRILKCLSLKVSVLYFYFDCFSSSYSFIYTYIILRRSSQE